MEVNVDNRVHICLLLYELRSEKGYTVLLFMNNFLEALRQDVLTAAPLLLGSRLVRGELSSEIVEVEAYRTPDDLGCHAHRGATPRNQQMFEEPGTAYVYFTYGNHWMLNVVAHGSGDAAAILIRAARPLRGFQKMFSRRPKAKVERDLLSGPGKLCAAYGIDGSLNGVDLFDHASELRIEIRKPLDFVTDTRIGLAKGKGDELQWRFVATDLMSWASRPVRK